MTHTPITKLANRIISLIDSPHWTSERKGNIRGIAEKIVILDRLEGQLYALEDKLGYAEREDRDTISCECLKLREQIEKLST